MKKLFAFLPALICRNRRDYSRNYTRQYVFLSFVRSSGIFSKSSVDVYATTYDTLHRAFFISTVYQNQSKRFKSAGFHYLLFYQTLMRHKRATAERKPWIRRFSFLRRSFVPSFLLVVGADSCSVVEHLMHLRRAYVRALHVPVRGQKLCPERDSSVVLSACFFFSF